MREYSPLAIPGKSYSIVPYRRHTDTVWHIPGLSEYLRTIKLVYDSNWHHWMCVNSRHQCFLVVCGAEFVLFLL